MKTTYTRRLLVALALIVGMVAINFSSASAQNRPKFRVAWSIYAGWMPWDYAGSSGILKKWADKYNVTIDLVRMDYVPSIEAFVAKKVDAVTVTNMEALDMPAAAGIDTTALIVGDYSNGNDAVQTREGIGFTNLRGQRVYLAELTVSHYLLNRCLDLKTGNKLTERDITLVNTSDADIAPAFIADKSQKVVVTWNPMVMQIAQQPGVRNICTSADIPGEILDLMVVRTDVLQKNPNLGKALTGAWYEVLSLMTRRGNQRATTALNYMAKASGATLTEFQSQLQTTAMFYTPQSAVQYTESAELKTKMDFVRQFCFKNGLLGQNAKSVDVVGIQYPDRTVQGDSKNVKLRFDTVYMRLAAEGKL
ncbi:MAG: putative urea ABC transporter substrate-binding protein [Candidatus Taylorbacteria bacterium]|nr:putative urea ABC transporter substrate-binding protein [Candidatus Taylorbacteria bacterium]